MKTKEVKIISEKAVIFDNKGNQQYRLTEAFYRRRRANEDEQELSDSQYYSMFMRGK